MLCPLPKPRITVKIWGLSPRAASTEEPDRGNLLGRIWRGLGVVNCTGLLCRCVLENPRSRLDV